MIPNRIKDINETGSIKQKVFSDTDRLEIDEKFERNKTSVPKKYHCSFYKSVIIKGIRVLGNTKIKQTIHHTKKDNESSREPGEKDAVRRQIRNQSEGKVIR